MATVSIATFKQHVRMKMDEMLSTGAVSAVGGEDEYAIDAIAEALVQECVDDVVLKAPVGRLTVTNSQPTISTSISFPSVTLMSGTTAARSALVFDIPLACLRFVSIDGGGLKRPVISLAAPDSAEARAQGNIYTMGRESHPVAVSDGKTIWLYSFTTAPGSSNPLYLNYVARVNTAGGIDDTVLQPSLISAAEWVCAARIFDTQGDSSRSQLCASNAQSLINGQ